MGEVVAILNQKGGCGKTTTAVNLAAALALMGKQILVIDLDPQGNATTAFGIEKNEVDKTIYTVLTGQDTMEEALLSTEISGLHLVPSNISLSGAEIELSKEVGYHTILDLSIDDIKEYYDYIFIDVPPSLGILTINSLMAADSVLIPIQAEFYALEGMADLMEAMELVETRLKSPSPIKGILLTLYDGRTRLGRDVYRNIKEYFGEREYVFKTVIPRNITLAEAPSHGMPCVIYDEESTGTEAYKKLAREFIQLEDNK
ncbi:MAG TPA: ParA family protein [Methanobacteriaceae archaeon]|jgi:chromosome partitioning protein|nr:ParA family protein [Euryarchaeota archaeon]HNR25573.1 ParA family protein [Methanobacteriaceae archaeon]